MVILKITSRYSQDFWTHGIAQDDSENVRYSFTFRNIDPHFIGSTIILGDSNTTHIKFGSEKGTLGPWMPGKRVKVGHIEAIPDPTEIGPYRNIVLHTGINSLNNPQYRRSNKDLINIYEKKCQDIMQAYPRAKIFVSLLLPTKVIYLNYQVQEFNNLLLGMIYKYKNISVIGQSIFGFKLQNEHGRYDTAAKCYNDLDVLHLGKTGLRIFASNIKSNVFKRGRSQSRQRHDASGGEYRDAVGRNTGEHGHDGYQSS